MFTIERKRGEQSMSRPIEREGVVMNRGLATRQSTQITAEAPTLSPVAPIAPPAPTWPLPAGWLVMYRDRSGRLRGGSDERQCGTVTACRWDGRAWRVTVRTGTRVPLSRITSVGQTNSEGQVVASWTIREQGHDGEGRDARIPEGEHREARRESRPSDRAALQ